MNLLNDADFEHYHINWLAARSQKRTFNGILMRCSCRLVESKCIFGEPLIRKERFWASWFRVDVISAAPPTNR